MTTRKREIFVQKPRYSNMPGPYETLFRNNGRRKFEVDCCSHAMSVTAAATPDKNRCPMTLQAPVNSDSFRMRPLSGLVNISEVHYW